MGKIIRFIIRTGKRGKITAGCRDYMEELKDQFSGLIQNYEDDSADVREVDTLTEALDAGRCAMRWSVKLLRKEVIIY